MPLKDPEQRRAYRRVYMRRWYRENKAKHQGWVRQRSTKYKIKIKQWLTDYKASLQCGRCGEDHPACLDFHHRDPASKEFNLAEAVGRCPSLQRLIREIGKCEVLCANCHRKLHHEGK